ncbi:MAG: hypothetical protein SGI73_04000 [Chloroflexota bacterium]|nr:hypothetical protein [Chloroflexota bacterium]
MQSPPRPSVAQKPTLDTKYRIDYTWWERNEDLRTYLLSHLPTDVREHLTTVADGHVIDHIDPNTGEVFRLDAISMAVQDAAKAPDFINPYTSVVDSIFRVFLANSNAPLTPRELSERIGRPAQTILKTLSGGRIWKGIRPTE